MRAVSIRLKVCSGGRLSGAMEHDERKNERIPGYINQSRTHLNRYLIKSDRSAKDIIAGVKEKVKRLTGRRMQAQAFPAVAGIITLSRDAQLGMTPDVFEKHAMESLKNVAEFFGNPEVVSASIHLDEAAPHLHFILENCDQRGKSVRKKMDKYSLSQIQDIAAEPWRVLDIYRGKRKSERLSSGEHQSSCINRSVKELHDDLPAEVEAARARLLEMEERVRKTQTKLLELDEREKEEKERLEKREAVYQKRLEERQKAFDELIKNLEIKEPPLPVREEVEVVTKSTIFGKQTERISVVREEKVVEFIYGVRAATKAVTNNQAIAVYTHDKLKKEIFTLKTENDRLRAKLNEFLPSHEHELSPTQKQKQTQSHGGMTLGK